MTSNPFFLISILISALITFATAVFIAQTFLILLKASSKYNTGRTRSLLRMLPFISLFIGLISSSLSIGYLFNPLNCTSCVQKLILTHFFSDFKNYLSIHEISLLCHLGKITSHILFKAIGIALGAVSLFLFSWRCFEAFCIANHVRKMAIKAAISARQIENPLLAYALLKNNVTIYECSEIDVPMATYSKRIFIPKKLIENLPQDEFEALIAHELEHIHWKDPITRLFSQLIASLFWWVPSHSWRKKLEFDQEVACDQATTRYLIPEASLASLLLKVSTHSKRQTHEIFCYFTQQSHPSLRRLEIMLQKHSPSSKWFEWVGFILILFILSGMVFCLMFSRI